ncbi:hypothetical protein BaRGS_00017011 [Batillaria attramentaria]|uniref:Uncharacterized protein n=1 Tax=Batillaria attramentaria TaxID=370345 RepID=A0ABD0KY62_9CAEN
MKRATVKSGKQMSWHGLAFGHVFWADPEQYLIKPRWWLLTARSMGGHVNHDQEKPSPELPTTLLTPRWSSVRQLSGPRPRPAPV